MIELNKIYCENCLDTMARMPDGFVDLTVTSPPYDGLRTYNGYSFEFEKIAKELFRVTKQGGVVVWVVGDETKNGCESLSSFKQAIFFVEQCGFNLHDTMIYKKNGYPFPPVNRYFSVFEYMFVFSNGVPKTTNLLKVKTTWKNNKKTTRQKDGSLKLMKYETGKEHRIKENIWVYETGYSKTTTDTMAFAHPAQFPEKLSRDHIYSWSTEGDLIYDPFMGSGTTAKMAHLMKRNWIGSEISQEYVDLANKRLRKYLDQADLFQLEKTNGKSHGEQFDIFTRIVLDGRNGAAKLKTETVEI